MRIPFNLFLLAIIIFSKSSLAGQGCSDAGACSVPVLRPEAFTGDDDKKNKVSVGLSAGMGDYDIFILTPSIGFARTISSKLAIDTRVTGALHSGNDISDFGPGDVFVNLQYFASSKFSLTGGVKIPLTKGDSQSDEFNVTLPMDYQSSLGTFDLIVGAGYQNDKWQLALGAQIPLTQNDNNFEGYPNSVLDSFPAYPGFERKPDLVIRILRKISMSEKMSLMAGLLPIFHLGEDEYTMVDESRAIEGSDGLTLNATLQLNLNVGDNGLFNFNVGFPFIVRDVRPDGLTRSFVAGVEYGVRF